MITSSNPVFIIASERSGTNLLRVRLTEAQEIYFGVSPAHLLKNLYYREPYFGPLADDTNFTKLLDAALNLCKVHFAPWNIDWTPESLLIDYGSRPRDTLFLMDFMMAKYTQEQGRERYISKENFLYEYALDIAARLPGARFIYLYRDPRDVIASQCKRHRYANGVLPFARLWQYEQAKAIRVHNILALQKRSIAISYEELIVNEASVIQRLLAFLKVDHGAKVEKFSERVDVVPHEWVNLSKPTMSENYLKYRQNLSKRQIKVIEGLCHLQMSHLGYGLEQYATTTPMQKSFILDRSISVFDKIMDRLFASRPIDPVILDRARLLRSLHVNFRNDR